MTVTVNEAWGEVEVVGVDCYEVGREGRERGGGRGRCDCGNDTVGEEDDFFDSFGVS